MAAGLGFKTFTTGEVLTANDTNGYLMQGVLVFASSAARASAITSPQEGQYSYLKDTNSTEYYDGAAWIAAPIGDITGVTAGVGITGGGTSGTVTVTNDMATTITASGDIVVGTGSGTYDNLPIGTTNQVLTADTTVSPYKVKWATPASGGLTYAGVSVHNDYYSITFTAYVDQFLAFASADQWDTNAFHDTATNNTRLTIPTGAGGKYLLTCFFSGGTSTQKLFTLKVNGATPTSLPVGISGSMAAIRTAGDPLCFSIVLNLAAADYVQMAVNANASGTEAGCYNTLQLSYLGA